MNIFALDTMPKGAAMFHADIHVGKMLLESCQILSTIQHVSGDDFVEKFQTKYAVELYRPTHRNHPCVKWAYSKSVNAKWLTRLAIYLAQEFHYRFDKQHKSRLLAEMFDDFYSNIEFEIPNTFALAMPEEYKPFIFIPTALQCVDAYRNYYRCEKFGMLKYTKRQKPFWI